MFKPYSLRLPALMLLPALLSGCLDQPSVEQQAARIVEQMSPREKIGQKIMMAFRYWCPDDQPACTAGMTELPEAASRSLRDNAIGGVILFANNLTDLQQTRRLSEQIRKARPQNSPVGLLIGSDQEGGNVFRLPRPLATSFPGNMALGAAYEATRDSGLARDSGRVLAAEIRAVGFNVNFAPDVDVNSNPLNPVINVRAYGDDPATISLLGQATTQGMREQGVIGSFKHFPGHGDTATDSHYGLPVVNKSRADAYAIDLAPYRQAIASGQPPEMIMTAHIQYPALDNSQITARNGERMIAPATMSRKIQHDLLRGEMGYQGVTVTDALDMKGISDFFEQADAVIKVFQADVDIALMPTEFRTAAQAGRLRQLIDQVAAAVADGRIDRAELDRSVRRIVAMKLRNEVTPAGEAKPLPELSTIGGAEHRAVEDKITRQSITLLRNQGAALPLRSPSQRIFILTPWGEQAEAMRRRFDEKGYRQVSGAKLSATPWEAQKQAIDQADVVVIGTLATGVSPVERNGDPNAPALAPRLKRSLPTEAASAPMSGNGSLVFNVAEDLPSLQTRFARSLSAPPLSEAQQMRNAMEYAKRQGKKLIHVTLRAPYDVINYDDLADATLATYSYYGYENGLRGPSMPALVDVMLGANPPGGKLPVAIHALDENGQPGALRYARGFGLRF
ncbi:glycoside hydrolase family 3 protein [Chromobacterium haemolyticum]|uniref:glycoside hydrolase family 3 protein n=1 Tax=Chromobacterium haemolyticum TaxID=394935 RepID=UPI0005BB896D|nr:glycoside hydrolase family 3 protein [Chromobacterium haemolyticum]